MPNSNSNAGLSLEALLAAARGADEETTGARAAAPVADASAASASTESAEPAAEPSAEVQEEAFEQAEEKVDGKGEVETATPAFDLAAALGYGSRDSEPVSAVKEPEEKFDLAAALGYKSQEVREREAAEAAAAEVAAQAQAVQAQAIREAEREARRESAMQDMRKAPSAQEEQEKRAQRAERIEKLTQQQDGHAPRAERDAASVRAADIPQVRSRTFEPSAKPASASPEERYAAKGAPAKSATAADGSTIESYQPTKRDRSAQARAARPLNKSEVSEVAQAIAADAARTEYVEPSAEGKSEATDSKPAADAAKETAAESTQEAKQPAKETPGAPASASEASAPAEEEAPKSASHEVAEVLKESIPAVAKPAAPEAAAPTSEPVIVDEKKPVIAGAAQQAPVQPKATETASAAPEPVGQPLPVIPPAAPAKPATMPHKVPVRTTEEIINPVQTPVRLGVISPETARHEAAAKKKVQSAERKIVKKVRRFRTLGMFLIVVALAALAGAIFLFVAGNAQANESIEATATEICEQAGRTITYRYKAADSNGTLCPTTEVATFSAGDVLEQSVITMNTPDFETAAHTLANFKKQFEKNSYVDGRVDGSTVIFTLHMSNERIMKVTYTALLMKNTTGCEVVI